MFECCGFQNTVLLMQVGLGLLQVCMLMRVAVAVAVAAVGAVGAVVEAPVPVTLPLVARSFYFVIVTVREGKDVKYRYCKQ